MSAADNVIMLKVLDDGSNIKHVARAILPLLKRLGINIKSLFKEYHTYRFGRRDYILVTTERCGILLTNSGDCWHLLGLKQFSPKFGRSSH